MLERRAWREREKMGAQGFCGPRYPTSHRTELRSQPRSVPGTVFLPPSTELTRPDKTC